MTGVMNGVVLAHVDAALDRAAVVALAGRVEKELAGLSKMGEITVSVTPQCEVDVGCAPADVLSVLGWLKADGFLTLIDVCGVDWLGVRAEAERFAVVYHLLSLTKNLRVRVTTRVADGETVPSAVPLWAGANWYEREVWDMFGIPFEGHPDLRRLLTDYDFDGHPLRKDFPLEGHVEVYFDKDQQRVAYKPVDLPQGLRNFDRVSDWKGMTGNAHLAETFDEKEFK